MRCEPMGSAKLVQCFCHCAVKYVKSYSLTKFVYYILVDRRKVMNVNMFNFIKIKLEK